MYVKVRVSSPFIGTEKYYAFEVDDDFRDYDETERACLIDDMTQEAIEQYVETDYEICEGAPEDDIDVSW